MFKCLTVIDVAERIEQAAQTLRKMPPVKVNGFKSFWPEIVYSSHEAYGWEQARFSRSVPTAKQISEMDEAFVWLTWVEKNEAQIVWARSQGGHAGRWKSIQRMFDTYRCIRSLQNDYKLAIVKITTLANAETIKMRTRNKCA